MKKPTAPTVGQKLWMSLETPLLLLLRDIALFLTVLAALVVGFAGVAGLKALGMRQERAEIIETVHFYGYLAVIVVFLLDLVAKVLSEALRKRP